MPDFQPEYDLVQHEGKTIVIQKEPGLTDGETPLRGIKRVEGWDGPATVVWMRPTARAH